MSKLIDLDCSALENSPYVAVCCEHCHTLLDCRAILMKPKRTWALSTRMGDALLISFDSPHSPIRLRLVVCCARKHVLFRRGALTESTMEITRGALAKIAWSSRAGRLRNPSVDARSKS